MSVESSDLSYIKRLCIINFLELQEIKRKLNISSLEKQEFYDYQNSVPEYMKELDHKLASLTREYPSLWEEK